MAAEPLIILNGTTADANDVMDLFNEIYTNIDETNVAAGNKTGSGKFVLQTSPTITTPVINTPAIATPTVTGPSTFNSGADINVYSDVATTLKFAVDGATGDVQSAGTAYIGTLSEGQVFNGGISVSGSTFTITQADGSAITAAKPLFVGVKSNTAGRVVLAKFTAPVSFTFGAASDTDGNLFGITDADWSNAMPFFLGVIYDGTTPYFTISRVPSYVSGAAATDLSQKGDTDADSQTDVMILATGLTLANFVNLPITQVGWFQMTYATAGGAWTASTSIHTGFNKEYEKIIFTFPQGQMGAAASSYFISNAGTLPVFDSRSIKFRIKSKYCEAFIEQANDGGTDGVGANDLFISVPFQMKGLDAVIGVADIEAATSAFCGISSIVTNQSAIGFQIPVVSGTSLQNTITGLQNSTFTNGSRFLYLSLTYPIIQ